MSIRLAVGEEFAGHKIERLIGRGGMGVVYLAEHLRLGRKVAIKILDPERAGDEEARERFIRESQLAAALDHRNIVQVYDAGEVDDVAYISMRFVEGMDLAALLRTEGRLPADRALALAAQVASALDAAHDQGLVHRDVKPANILLSPPDPGGEWQAFLSDFGVTKRITAEPTTEPGSFMGTIDYMAPEQIRGGAVDGRADQYSLACVLYQCIAGTVPFPRGDQVSVLYAHLQEPPPRMRTEGIDLASGVDVAIRRGMSKRPETRFATCSAMVAAASSSVDVLGRLTRAPAPGGLAESLVSPVGAADSSSTSPIPALRGTRQGLHRDRRRRGRRVIMVLVAAASVVAGGVAVLFVAGSGGSPRLPGGTAANDHPSQPGSVVTFPANIAWVRVHEASLGGAGHQMINRAAVSGSEIVAVGDRGPVNRTNAVVWISTDSGTHWAEHIPDEGGGPGGQEMTAVAYAGNQFVAIGTNRVSPTENAAEWTSSDGLIWRIDAKNPALSGPGSQVFRRLAFIGHRLIVVGTDSRTTPSEAAAWVGEPSDGGWRWTEVSLGPDPRADQDAFGIARLGQSIFVVGSSTDVRTGDVDAAVWGSHDGGSSWTREGMGLLAEPRNQVMRGVVVTGDGMLAVGTEQHHAAIWTTADGRTWTQHMPGFHVQGVTGVISYRGGFVMYGATGSDANRDAAVWTSLDGVTWTLASSPGFTEARNQLIKTMVVSDGRLIAAGVDQGGRDGDAAVWVGTPEPAGSPAEPSPSPSAT